MLGRTLKKKYFEIETNIENETYNDTNYDNNYNEIFKNNGPKLDRQILPINELDSQLNSK